MARQHHRPCSPAHRQGTVQLMAEVYIRAQVAVERGYRRPLTLATLARSLAVSPRQLERAYDEIGLTTFAAHLRAVRLRNAAELLAHQPLTVTDVARLVGYTASPRTSSRPSGGASGSPQGRSATPPVATRRWSQRRCEPVAPVRSRAATPGPRPAPTRTRTRSTPCGRTRLAAGAKRTQSSALTAPRRWRRAPTDSTPRTMPVPSPSSRRRPRSRTRCWPDSTAPPTQRTTAGARPR